MPEDRRGKKLALDDLNDIEELKKFPPFIRYWMRVVLKRREDASNALLTGKLTYSPDPVERKDFDAWNSVFLSFEQDEAGCRNLLAAAEADRN